jgi:hypothetical protein
MTKLHVIFAVFVFSIFALTPVARGAELLSKIHPYISISEEYDDNLNLTPSNKKDDFITTVQPGIKFSNMDKTGGLDLDYKLGLVFYNKDRDKNYVSHNAQLTGKYQPKEHLSFTIRESFTRSDEPREREYFTTSADNSYFLSTDTKRYIYWRNVISPTIEHQFGPENRIGVTYRNNIYQTEDPTGKNSREDYISPYYTYWFNRQNGIHFEYGYTRGDFEKEPDLKDHRGNIRYTRRFSAKSSAFADYTFSSRAYDNPGLDYDVHEPTIGATFALTPALTALLQAGYYWKVPGIGGRMSGFSYRGELASVDPRTSYRIVLQGGHKEDLFTAENLGFSQYNRLSLYATHKLTRRFSIGFNESLEKAKYENPTHEDVIWVIGGNLSYQVVKWMTFSLDFTHSERDSTIDANDYTDNRGMFRITATY